MNDGILILTREELIIDFDDSDNVILNALFLKKYNRVCPKCNWHKPFVKTPKKRSFHCTRCSYQIFPCAGTIFEKTLIPLGWCLLLILELMADPDLLLDDFLWEWMRDGDNKKFFISKESMTRIYSIIKKNINHESIIVSK